jgi:hypothetical protein
METVEGAYFAGLFDLGFHSVNVLAAFVVALFLGGLLHH